MSSVISHGVMESCSHYRLSPPSACNVRNVELHNAAFFESRIPKSLWSFRFRAPRKTKTLVLCDHDFHQVRRTWDRAGHLVETSGSHVELYLPISKLRVANLAATITTSNYSIYISCVNVCQREPHDDIMCYLALSDTEALKQSPLLIDCQAARKTPLPPSLFGSPAYTLPKAYNFIPDRKDRTFAVTTCFAPGVKSRAIAFNASRCVHALGYWSVVA